MRHLVRAVVLCLAVATLSAQLLPEQRVLDFQVLASLYAKRYAPLEWKRQALNFDLLDLKPWLDRVRAAKDDLEYFEIQNEYGAMLQDTHSYVYMNSNFRADLGITLDIYDGAVLIDGINRTRLPAATYPFAIGDEFVSLDGRTSQEWIALICKYKAYGNPGTSRRNAAAAIAVRSQSTFPRAVEIGDAAAVVIRRANGDLEDYTLPWLKTGLPVVKPGPAPMPRAIAAADEDRLLNQLQTWKLPDTDPLLQPLDWADENGEPRKYVNGIGARTPLFRLGFPESFVPRLGASGFDFHYTGTYKVRDKTIGYIRVPSFTNTSRSQAVSEAEREILYMQQNTDGLVIDVMRNPGGGCYMYDLAARLIPYPFYFFGEHIRVTQDYLMSIQATLESARTAKRDPWIIAVYESYVEAYKEAFANNRGLTRPIAACNAFGSTWPPNTEGNVAAATVYTKPIIVLVDEFSISAADIFPAMMQDNRRALLVGMRTSGGGGSVSLWPGGIFSDTIVNNTNSIVVRRAPVATAEYPAAPYVENIGSRPDVVLDYMTRDNLLNNGKTFVDEFTGVLLKQIDKAEGPQPRGFLK
jgi:hypothetical protein